jgi:hypothetical protein
VIQRDQTDRPFRGVRPDRIRRSPWVVPVAVVVGSVVALLIVSLFVTMIRSALCDDHGPGLAGRGVDHVVSAPRDGRDTAVLELESGATAVHIGVTPDDALFRASTSDGAKQLPVVSVVGDQVQPQLVDSGVNGASGRRDAQRCNAMADQAGRGQH